MSYIGTPINDSPTIVGKAKSAISSGAFLAAKFDGSDIVLCGVSGEASIGILMPETPDSVSAGDDVDLQIKDIGLWKAGAAVSAGAELTPDANGKAITATGGAYIMAIALEAATAANQVIRVQITKSGYKPTAASLALGDLTDVDTTGAASGDALKYDGTSWKPTT